VLGQVVDHDVGLRDGVTMGRKNWQTPRGIPCAPALTQFGTNTSSMVLIPSETRTKADLTPAAFTRAQSMVPCHFDTSMPSGVLPFAHTVAGATIWPPPVFHALTSLTSYGELEQGKAHEGIGSGSR